MCQLRTEIFTRVNLFKKEPSTSAPPVFPAIRTRRHYGAPHPLPANALSCTRLQTQAHTTIATSRGCHHLALRSCMTNGHCEFLTSNRGVVHLLDVQEQGREGNAPPRIHGDVSANERDRIRYKTNRSDQATSVSYPTTTRTRSQTPAWN